MAIHFIAALFAVLFVSGHLFYREPVAVVDASGVSLPLVNNTSQSSLALTPVDHEQNILNYDFPYFSVSLNSEKMPVPLLQSSSATEVQQVKQAH